MKLQAISSINFESNKKLLPDNIMHNLTTVLDIMNKNAESSVNNASKKYLNYCKNAEVIYYPFDVNNASASSYNIILNIDDAQLIINQNTGEIIGSHKPFFSRWKTIFSHAETYFNKIISEYKTNTYK